MFENETKKHKIKIEARKRNNGWEVFKTRIDGDSSNLISEHFIEDRKQALKLINRLKRDTSLFRSRQGIMLKRVYKEEFLEKWTFTIDDENIKNFLYVKFDPHVRVDIVIHEKYVVQEKKVIEQIEERLGLKEIGEEFLYEVYYFRRSNAVKRENEIPVDNLVDIEFDFNEEYY